MEIDAWLSWTARFLGAALALFWGGLAPLVQVLLALMAIDIVSGLLAGYVARALSSDVSLRGMAKKALMLLLVGAAMLVQPASGLDFLADAVAGFFVTHELLSIIENAANAGLPIPAILRDALAKVPGAEQVPREQT